MCDFDDKEKKHDRYGFIVDTPEIRELVSDARRAAAEIPDVAQRLKALEPSFAKLLAADGWLPEEYGSPDHTSGMGGGIGQYALYRAEDGSMTLFSLVIPAGVSTPVHDHLAWGLIGVYRGRQEETIYVRKDDGSRDGVAELEVSRTLHADTGTFYGLMPPRDDIHYVKTISDTHSVSIHLLANDTACVWRHKFDPDASTVQAFRSGYSNAPCDDEVVA